MPVFNNVLEAMGKTPLIRLNKLTTLADAEILVKFEALNVGGSIKTRTAYNMILRAEQEGRLHPDSIIVEPTSGNQGIGLALIGAVRGYRTIIIMPDSVSIERSKLVKHYGAEVILIHDDGDIGKCIDDCRIKAEQLAAENSSDSTNLTMRRVNVIGAENIVDMCLKRKIGRLVYLSSAYALNPDLIGKDTLELHFDRNKVEGEYAKSKAETAAYIMEKVALNRLNAVMVLPTFIIGPGYSQDDEINKILNGYLKGGVAPLKGGGHAFVDVRDVANAMITLTTEGEPGTGYLVTGEYKTSEEFFKEVNEVQGIDAPVKTASRLVTSKSLARFVDAYFRITHKENPKQVYALFSDNPTWK